MHESTVYFLGEWPNTLLLRAYTTTQFISCCKQAGTLNVGESPFCMLERPVVPELLRLLTNDSLAGWVRGGIAHALTVIGEPSIARDLVKLLPDENISSSLRWLLAFDLGELGEHSIVPELVRLLSDSSLDDYVGSGIAHTLGTLGERSVVPELLHLLSDSSLDRVIRMNIGKALAVLANDEETVCILATYLDKSDIANTILHVLWRISLQIGVRIFSITDDRGEKQIEISRL